MYGNLIQLTSDGAASSKWRRVPVASAGGGGPFDEAHLQEVLFRHAEILPLVEIDPAYDGAVPVCRELGTRAGAADALYLTPTGKIVLAEFKLWRNPEARREVIGQILDYARVLASWSYDDLEREVRSRTKRSPYEIVSQAHGDVREALFVDRVARNLKRGEFLLLIIGDGIREGVKEIVDYVQEHSGLRFNLALVEAAVFRRGSGDGDDLIIQPRVLAKTELIQRTILVRKTLLEETDDDPVEEHEPTPVEDENERFWTAVLREFAFDDRKLTAPDPATTSELGVPPGHRIPGRHRNPRLRRGRRVDARALQSPCHQVASGMSAQTGDEGLSRPQGPVWPTCHAFLVSLSALQVGSRSGRP